MLTPSISLEASTCYQSTNPKPKHILYLLNCRYTDLMLDKKAERIFAYCAATPSVTESYKHEGLYNS